MNILPKKSWHVRTRKNIEKVRRDEAQAAEEERRKQERISLAEREARTDFLRKKARRFRDEDTEGREEAHVRPADIFEGVNHGEGDKRVNKEHEKEEKARKEEWEQKVGILTYLHKKDRDIDDPWYLKSHEERIASKKNKDQASTSHSSEDPLIDMKKYLTQITPSSPVTQSLVRKQEDERSKRRNDGKSRSKNSSSRVSKEDNDRKRRYDNNEESKSRTDDAKIEKLREQRLKREEKERKRQERLLNSSGMTPVRNEGGSQDRIRRFNSQFNPHLSKN